MRELLDLDEFKGPLELLLTLVQAEEISLTRIDLVRVIDQVLEQLKRDEDLNECGNVVVIIATLIELKSKLCLPGEVDLNEEISRLKDDLLEKIVVHRRLTSVLDVLENRVQRRLSMHSRPNQLEGFVEEISIPLERQSVALLLECLKGLGETPRRDNFRVDYTILPIEHYQQWLLEQSAEVSFRLTDLVRLRRDRLDMVGLLVVLLEWVRQGKLHLEAIYENAKVKDVFFHWGPSPENLFGSPETASLAMVETES